MNTTTAGRLVVASMVVSSGVVIYDLTAGKQKGTLPVGSAFKTLWALGVLFMLLAVAADIVPGIAGPFAGLMALSILVGRSATVNEIVNVVPSVGGGK